MSIFEKCFDWFDVSVDPAAGPNEREIVNAVVMLYEKKIVYIAKSKILRSLRIQNLKFFFEFLKN